MPAKKPQFTKPKQEAYLDQLRNGVRRGQAADLIKVPRRIVREHVSLHDDFEEKVLDAEQDALENVEEALYQAAISGSVPACKAWLDYKRGPAPPGGEQSVESMVAEMNAIARGEA